MAQTPEDDSTPWWVSKNPAEKLTASAESTPEENGLDSQKEPADPEETDYADMQDWSWLRYSR